MFCTIKLAQFLGKLKTRCIFFEPHCKKEFKGFNYYKNYDEEEFVLFVKKYINLKKHTLIGRVHDGRAIYKIY